MSFKSLIDLYIHGKDPNNDIRKIMDELPSNEEITKEILEKLNNKTTKLKCEEEIKGSYYVFLNDTIYLSNNRASKDYARLTLIAHECIHSIQSKLGQVVNFLLSNLEMILFIIVAILKILKKTIPFLENLYWVIVTASILIRMALEMHASIRSISLTKEYMSKKIKQEDTLFAMKIIRFQVMALLPFMLLSLFFWKMIRVIVINIL